LLLAAEVEVEAEEVEGTAEGVATTTIRATTTTTATKEANNNRLLGGVAILRLQL
jgi:hypothetical protein